MLQAVDGSGSITPDQFVKQKQLCKALAARMKDNAQLGVIQFGGSAVIVASLTSDIPSIEAKVQSKFLFLRKAEKKR